MLGELFVQLSFQDFQPSLCDHNPPTSQTDDMQSQDRALHYSASCGNYNEPSCC